jgi:hypothetical protein
MHKNGAGTSKGIPLPAPAGDDRPVYEPEQPIQHRIKHGKYQYGRCGLAAPSCMTVGPQWPACPMHWSNSTTCASLFRATPMAPAYWPPAYLLHQRHRPAGHLKLPASTTPPYWPPAYHLPHRHRPAGHLSTISINGTFLLATCRPPASPAPACCPSDYHLHQRHRPTGHRAVIYLFSSDALLGVSSDLLLAPTFS